MKRFFTLLSIFIVLNSYSCVFTVNLHDTFGDGWNGNSITITVNGVAVLTNITVATGSDATYTFNANTGDVVVVTYNAGGSWQSENEYTITNPNFYAVWSDGQGGVIPSGGTFSADCAALPPPPPSNDQPCTAEILDPVTSTCVFHTFTTESALNSTAVPTPSCSWSFMGGDVWFTATVPASGRLAVTLGAQEMTEGGVAIYSGPDCNTLTEIACAEQTWGMPGSVYVSELEGLAGQTVWIRVWDPNNDFQGTFDICVWENPPMLEVSTTAYTPSELIEEVLITGCLDASNVVYDGPDVAIGAFSNGSVFGFETGIIMGCGAVGDICGDDTFGDNIMWNTSSADVMANISSISSANGGSTSIYDQVMIEFDFVPSSAITEFNFVFASDEYPTFEHTSYNDVFGFFVSGPGIAGPYADGAVNVAVIPSTTIPITISTVNGTDNSAYFGGYVTAGPEFNTGGYTIPITATMAGLIPCETYHIKFVIADAGDGSLTSYVMFEAGSFTSGGDVMMSHFSSVGTENEVYEGCENYWVFQRIDTTNMDSLEVVLDFTGTAVNGVDITPFPTSFYILPGEIYDTLYYSAIVDNLPEGTEYIVFGLENGCPCSVTTINDTIWIHDNFELNPVISNDETLCWNESATLSTTYNPALDPTLVTWLWSTGETTQNITVSPSASQTYWVTMTVPCTPDTVLSVDITVIPEIIASFTLADSVCAGASTTLSFTGTAGPDAVYTWDFDGATVVSGTGAGPYQLMWTTPGTQTVSLTIDDDVCTDDFELDIVVSQVPSTDFTVGEILCAGGTMDVTFTGIGAVDAVYDWNFDGATILSGSGQGPYEVTWMTFGDYTITLNSVTHNGCTSMSSNSIDVYVPQALSVDYTTTDVTCNGLCNGRVNVTITGGVEPYVYSWSNGLGVTSTGQINTLCADINYGVTVSDANNCAINTNFEVDQPTPIAIVITGTDPLCSNGSDGTGTVSASGGTPPYTYQWTDPTNATTSTVSTLSAGTYTVFVTDANNCVTSGTLTLNNPGKVYVNAPADRWICIGQSAILSGAATGGAPDYTYTWRDMTSGAFYNTPSITVSPTVTNTYEVFCVDQNNCRSITEEVVVNVHPPISMTVLPEKDTICPGEPVTVFATITGGNGGPYMVTDQDGNIVAPPYQTYPLDNMTITITANDLCGSPNASGSVGVIVMPPPPVTFMAESTAACAPFDVHFVEVNDLDGRTFEWDFGDYESYNTSDQQNPSHLYENAGVYDVTLTATSAYGCTATAVLNDYITVYPNPIAQFTPNPYITTIVNPIVHFENTSIGGDIYLWDFGDSDSSEFFNPTHPYDDEPQTYDVILVVQSIYGCVDTAEAKVVIQDEFTFYAPTAFKPNSAGDNGFFFVIGNGIESSDFSMIIYDRWGETVFSTTDYDPETPATYGWNGRIKDNDLAPTGVYTWMVNYLDGNGNYHEKAGFVTLLR